MSTVVGIGTNAVQDGVEDFTQAFIYRRMKNLTDPFLKEYESGTEFDDAMQSFIQTLSMGCALYAYTKVTSFFFDRGIKLAGVLWTYIIAGAMKKKVFEKLKQNKMTGGKAGKLLSLFIGSDRTSDRIEIAKMIKDDVKSFDTHKFHYQNQQNSLSNNLDSFAQTSATMKKGFDDGSVQLFNHKTFSGTWSKTKEDKKLFEKVTGKTLVESGSGSWSSLYGQLNKYTEFYKTVDGEVTNLATSLQKILARSGMLNN